LLGARHLVLLLACACCLPASAQATQTASLHVAFIPPLLGHGTTIDFSAQISTPTGLVPSPLTTLDVHYPRELGIATSGLGITSCSAKSLEAQGPEGCPVDSQMGQGSAVAAVPIGPIVLEEAGEVTIVRGPQQEGHLGLLFYVNAGAPINAQIVFSGVLLPGPGADEGTLHIEIPLVPGVAGSPNVAVVQLQVMIGARGLTYYEHVHGTFVAYRPAGVLLPHRCPRGGFPFAASFAFEDGSNALASTTVPCPTHGGRVRQRPARAPQHTARVRADGTWAPIAMTSLTRTRPLMPQP